MKMGRKVHEALRSGAIASKPRVRLTPGRALRIYRELGGLTQAALARKTGLTQATISGLEVDRLTLGLERAKVLARALNVHPAVLAFPDWEFDRKRAA